MLTSSRSAPSRRTFSSHRRTGCAFSLRSRRRRTTPRQAQLKRRLEGGQVADTALPFTRPRTPTQGSLRRGPSSLPHTLNRFPDSGAAGNRLKTRGDSMSSFAGHSMASRTSLVMTSIPHAVLLPTAFRLLSVASRARRGCDLRSGWWRTYSELVTSRAAAMRTSPLGAMFRDFIVDRLQLEARGRAYIAIVMRLP